MSSDLDDVASLLCCIRFYATAMRFCDQTWNPDDLVKLQQIVAIDDYVRSAGPAQFAHRPAGVPDLGHVVDLAAFERHDLDIVGRSALACRWQSAALTGVSAMEHGPDESRDVTRWVGCVHALLRVDIATAARPRMPRARRSPSGVTFNGGRAGRRKSRHRSRSSRLA